MKRILFLMVCAIIMVAGTGTSFGHSCCLADGSCAQGMLSPECDANGGVYADVACWNRVCEPPGGDDCSPGYWKNHTEEWFGIYCVGTDCDDLLADLDARGRGSGDVRDAAAAFLNGAAEAATGTTPCTED